MSLSGSDSGNFVVSVKDSHGIHHFEIEASYANNLKIHSLLHDISIYIQNILITCAYVMDSVFVPFINRETLQNPVRAAPWTVTWHLLATRTIPSLVW